MTPRLNSAPDGGSSRVAGGVASPRNTHRDRVPVSRAARLACLGAKPWANLCATPVRNGHPGGAHIDPKRGGALYLNEGAIPRWYRAPCTPSRARPADMNRASNPHDLGPTDESERVCDYHGRAVIDVYLSRCPDYAPPARVGTPHAALVGL